MTGSARSHTDNCIHARKARNCLVRNLGCGCAEVLASCYNGLEKAAASDSLSHAKQCIEARSRTREKLEAAGPQSSRGKKALYSYIRLQAQICRQQPGRTLACHTVDQMPGNTWGNGCAPLGSVSCCFNAQDLKSLSFAVSGSLPACRILRFYSKGFLGVGMKW